MRTIRPFIIPLFAFCVIAIILFVLLFLDEPGGIDIQDPSVQEIEEVDEIAGNAHVSNLPINENSSSSPTPLPSDNESTVHISIVDPFHDPVPAGNITINQETFPFQKGLFYLPGEFVDQKIEIRAEPFRSTTISITKETIRDVTVALDYVFGFDCIVSNQSAKGTIELWKAWPCSRPIPHNSGLHVESVHTDRDKPVYLSFERKNGIRPRLESNPPFFSGSGLPFISDRLIAFGERHDSVHKVGHDLVDTMKIFDSINGLYELGQLTESKNRNYFVRDFLVFKHDDTLIQTPVIRPEIRDENLTKIREQKLNNSAFYHFEGLHPGIYAIRVVNANFAGRFELVYPSKKTVHLNDLGKSNLYVTVIRNDIKIKNLTFLPDTVITLRPVDQAGLYYAKTGSKSNTVRERGSVRFENLPFGTYDIFAESPLFPKQSKRIILNEIKQQCEIIIPPFGNTISGVVREAANHSPVKNLIVELVRKTKKDFVENTFGVYSNTETNKKGEFEFHNVVNGIYQFRFGDEQKKALFLDKTITWVKNPSVTIHNQDQKDVELLVDIYDEIKIRGIVVDQDDIPVQGVSVTTTDKEIAMHTAVTDPQGHFEVTIIKNPEKKKTMTLLAVHQEKIDDNRYRRTAWARVPLGKMRMPETGGEIIGTATETVSIEKASKTKEVKLVLSKSTPWHRLHGQIIGSDNQDFGQAHLIAKQENQYVYGNIFEDGTYSIEGLEPGEVHLYCRSFAQDPRNPKYNYYADMQITISNQNKSTRYDIHLPRSSFLAGTIRCNDAIKKNVTIVIKHQENKYNKFVEDFDGVSMGKLDDQGRFWIGNLLPDQQYQLHVFKDYNDESPVYVSPFYKSGLDNIIIVLE